MMHLYTASISCSLIFLLVTSIFITSASWRHGDLLKMVVLQHGHVVWSTAIGHTTELLRGKSELANIS
jgi:hypothetical protein